MQTVAEVARAVVANPEAYEHAFPVSRPEPAAESTWERFVFAPPFTRDSVGQRILDRNRGRWQGLDNGEPISPGRCYLCDRDRPCVSRALDSTESGTNFNVSVCINCLSHNSYNGMPIRAWGDTDEAVPPFIVDDTVPPNEIRVGHSGRYSARIVNLPEEEAVPRTATAAMIREDTRRARRFSQAQRLDMQVYGDGSGELAAERPDHYRVTRSRCSCGFTTIFHADMQDHIDDTLIECAADGVFRRWRVCERCQASALCREVAVMRPARLTFAPPNEPPEHWPVERVYRCDNCTRGL